MNHLALQDRPREKLERGGVAALGDNELLAVLIGHGCAGTPALALAERLLAGARGIHGLTRIDREELAQVPGIGPVLAARIQAAIELGRRTLTLPAPRRLQFGHPHEIAGFLLPQYGAFRVERFGVVLLDARHRLLRTKLLSTGSRDSSLAQPREIFREAAIASASAVVAFHNHPSGDPTPSADDVLLTRRLVAAGHLMGIDLLDHIILADNTYCSFRRMGKL